MAHIHFSNRSPQETANALRQNADTQLIDVRERGEFESEHVPGSINLPLSSFTSSADRIARSAPVYVLCQSGARAVTAAKHLMYNGHTTVAVVTGGLNAWKKQGLATTAGERHVWDLERQVRLAAGLLVATGVGLSFVNRWFILISGVAAGGLIFSGLTGICGMALLLARCPWNRR